MLNYNLDTFYAAMQLVRMCEKYKDKADVDVIQGRYTVDACSALAVHALVGHIVTLEIQTNDDQLRAKFAADLKKIKSK